MKNKPLEQGETLADPNNANEPRENPTHDPTKLYDAQNSSSNKGHSTDQTNHKNT